MRTETYFPSQLTWLILTHQIGFVNGEWRIQLLAPINIELRPVNENELDLDLWYRTIIQNNLNNRLHTRQHAVRDKHF
jgi:hypothetical protein